jgi:hypothetical protein
MQRQIIHYRLIYNPDQHQGRIDFQLAGDSHFMNTPTLNAEDFSALAILLAQNNLVYDTNSHTFYSSH